MYPFLPILVTRETVVYDSMPELRNVKTLCIILSHKVFLRVTDRYQNATNERNNILTMSFQPTTQNGVVVPSLKGQCKY